MATNRNSPPPLVASGVAAVLADVMADLIFFHAFSDSIRIDAARFMAANLDIRTSAPDLARTLSSLAFPRRVESLSPLSGMCEAKNESG